MPTALAGTCGMNFETMPELTWRYGSLAVLVLGGAACGGPCWRFKLNGWRGGGAALGEAAPRPWADGLSG